MLVIWRNYQMNGLCQVIARGNIRPRDSAVVLQGRRSLFHMVNARKLTLPERVHDSRPISISNSTYT